jgi:hypothetical protein
MSTMALFTQIGLYVVGVSLSVVAVQAGLPLAEHNPEANLKDTTEVTFDPLAVAAILHNPRAKLSAGRLYTQYDRSMFTWPHTMMIGGSLAPVKMLIQHLTTDLSTVHPALRLCTDDELKQDLKVKTNMVFKVLQIDFSNSWLHEVVDFPSSHKPGNDFMVVCVDGTVVKEHRPSRTRWAGRVVLDLIAVMTGLILVTGIVFAVLTADVWALTLFFFYGTHWAAGLAVSTRSLVKVHSDDVANDKETEYAIYDREVGGGTVVFKGSKETMEKWGRLTWEFNQNYINSCLHWFWVITGTLSAISSIACMVNMRGYMQLGFLGLLVYSSLAEILATRVTRILLRHDKGIDASLRVGEKRTDASFRVGGKRTDASRERENDTRTQAIIRATVQVDWQFRLVNLDWVALGGLPNELIFKNMVAMLKSINAYQKNVEDEKEPIPADEEIKLHPEIQAAIKKVLDTSLEDTPKFKPPDLPQRIETETLDALRVWSRELRNEANKKEKATPSPLGLLSPPV